MNTKTDAQSWCVGFFVLSLYHQRKTNNMANYIFEHKDKVRDYECDLQGIVNNANYQHYLEHCRHEFLLNNNISFAKLHEQGTDAVVARLTMQFKVPLKSGDEYVTKLWIKKESVKYVFMQDIFRLPDMKLCIRAQVESVCLVNGKLTESKELSQAFAPFLEK